MELRLVAESIMLKSESLETEATSVDVDKVRPREWVAGIVENRIREGA